MEQDKLRIGVIHIYNFPVGLAPTTRITAYCKGLLSLGHYVDIFSIQPQKKDAQEPMIGTCDGGNYYHFSRMPKFRIPILTGWSLIVYNIIKLLRHINRTHRRKKYDAMILSFDEPYQLGIIGSYLKKKGIVVIAIADEYPIPIRKYLKDSVPKIKLLRYKRVYRNIDARILMTSKLQQFYDGKVGYKPTILLSTIVDTDRFENVVPLKYNRSYICYMGNMELSKDNVDNIIYAFNIIKNLYPELDLHLYGAPSVKTHHHLKTIIANLNLTDRVFIKGTVTYKDVPAVLTGATILVSSQPDTKRAEGGFPTKLGEYFMTGIPTLLTDVGEISSYVQNNINGYCVPPCDPDAYAHALEYIMSHYEEALSVAKNAKTYIISNFGYQVAGRTIANFIRQLQISN